MKVSESLFGQDKSRNFLQNLPKISIKRFISLLFIYFLTCVLLVVVVILLGRALGIHIDAADPLIIGTFLCIYTILLIFFYGKDFNLSSKLLKEQLLSVKVTHVVKHVIVLSIIAFILGGCILFFKLITDPVYFTETKDYFETAPTSTDYLKDLLLVIYMFLFVGILEELIFRGILYRWLRSRYSRYVAIIISASIFSIIHPSSWDWAGFTVKAMIGSIYAFYYEYKNNILTIMIAHSLEDIINAGLTTLTAYYFASLFVGG